MKYKDWLQEYLYLIKRDLKKRTYKRYDGYVRNQIIPRLGDYDIDKLNSLVLERFTTELSEEYASNTVSGVIQVIKRSLSAAKKNKIISIDESEELKCRASTLKEIFCLTPQEQRKLENYILSMQVPKLFGMIISLYTGVRIGELLALKWRDIDFNKFTLTIRKSCHDEYETGQYEKYEDLPKTKSSIRIIPFPKQLLPYLRQLKKESCSPYVVEGKEGKIITVRTYQNNFKQVLKKLDLPNCGFHSLRHTFATRCLENGMDIKTLSDILGHKNPEITLKTYAHCLIEHKVAMMNKIGKIFQAKA